jgi:hypothetical protein
VSAELTESGLSRPPTWLLTVTYAGAVYRFSSEPVSLVDEEGEQIRYDGGLDPVELTRSVSGPGGEPDELSIPIEVYWPDDVAELEAAGHALDAATAEVALLPYGGTYAGRAVVLSGRVVEPVYGDVDEPVSFSVEAFPWDDSRRIPAADHTVSLLTWPQGTGFELPDDSVGLYYPIVIGTPGWLSRVPSSTTSGSPSIVVSYHSASAESRKILIAGHRVNATAVLVFWDGGTTSLSVTHEEDALGNVCAVVDLGTGGAINSSSFYWIGWNSTAGAMPLDDQDASGARKPMEGAGDVCEWALRQTSLQVDRGQWAAARERLNRYRLAGYINESVSPWQWLVENILPLLPVSIHQGPSGLYPVIWRHDATAGDALVSLVEGENVTRVGRVERESRDRVVNEVRLNHGLRARTGDHRGRTVMRGDALTDAGEIPSYAAEVSRSNYGSVVWEHSTDWIYGDDIAAMVAADKIAANASPGRTIRYSASSELAWLPGGSPVDLTDSRLHISGQSASVMEVAWLSESEVEILLRISSVMQRDSRVA